MKLLVIALSGLFLVACGKNGELSNTKNDTEYKHKHHHNSYHNHNRCASGCDHASHMKLSKKDTSIDANTTKTGETIQAEVKKSQPMYDTGMRPSSSK